MEGAGSFMCSSACMVCVCVRACVRVCVCEDCPEFLAIAHVSTGGGAERDLGSVAMEPCSGAQSTLVLVGIHTREEAQG